MSRFLLILAVSLVAVGCGPKDRATEPPTVNLPLQTKGKVELSTVPSAVMHRAAQNVSKEQVYSNPIVAILDGGTKEFGSKHEFGWRAATAYKNYGDMPAGWWVYAEPYWVIWELKSGKRGP